MQQPVFIATTAHLHAVEPLELRQHAGRTSSKQSTWRGGQLLAEVVLTCDPLAGWAVPNSGLWASPSFH